MALFDGVKAARGSHSKAEIDHVEDYQRRRAKARALSSSHWQKYNGRRAAGAAWPMWRDIEWNHYDAQPTEPRYNLED